MPMDAAVKLDTQGRTVVLTSMTASHPLARMVSNINGLKFIVSLRCCIPALLRCCTPALLHCCTPAPLRFFITLLIPIYTSYLLHSYLSVLLPSSSPTFLLFYTLFIPHRNRYSLIYPHAPCLLRYWSTALLHSRTPRQLRFFNPELQRSSAPYSFILLHPLLNQPINNYRSICISVYKFYSFFFSYFNQFLIFFSFNYEFWNLFC